MNKNNKDMMTENKALWTDDNDVDDYSTITIDSIVNDYFVDVDPYAKLETHIKDIIKHMSKPTITKLDKDMLVKKCNNIKKIIYFQVYSWHETCDDLKSKLNESITELNKSNEIIKKLVEAINLLLNQLDQVNKNKLENENDNDNDNDNDNTNDKLTVRSLMKKRKY